MVNYLPNLHTIENLKKRTGEISFIENISLYADKELLVNTDVVYLTDTIENYRALTKFYSNANIYYFDKLDFIDKVVATDKDKSKLTDFYQMLSNAHSIGLALSPDLPFYQVINFIEELENIAPKSQIGCLVSLSYLMNGINLSISQHINIYGLLATHTNTHNINKIISDAEADSSVFNVEVISKALSAVSSMFLLQDFKENRSKSSYFYNLTLTEYLEGDINKLSIYHNYLQNFDYKNFEIPEDYKLN